MNSKPLSEKIGDQFGVKANGGPKKTINRAIRTLAGGNELLNAIEASNASRNHAHRAGDQSRVTAMDAAIDNLEDIRAAMEAHVISAVG